MRVPPNWVAESESDGDLNMDSPGDAVYFFVGVTPDLPRGFSLDDLDESLQDELKSRSPYVLEAIDFARISVGPEDVRAIRRDYWLQVDRQDCRARVTSLMLVFDDRAYFVFAAICDDSVDRYKNVIEVLLDTFNP